MSSSPSSPSKGIAQLRTSLPLYLSKSSETIVHLRRLLSTTSNLDTTLLTLTYTFHLLNSLLPQPGKLNFTSSSRFARLRSSLSPLAALIDEYRSLIRLGGLLSITNGAIATYLHPPQDAIVKYVTALQLTSIAIFQALENGALLANKGVLAWSAEKRMNALRWSCRAWMIYTWLELGKLGWELRKRKTAPQATKQVDDKEEKSEVVLAEQKDEADRWWNKWKRDVSVNLAYAPMTVHYSFGPGFLSEGPIGALGCVVAWFSMREAWKSTA